MNLTPLRQRVLVKPDAIPAQTESGLHLVEHWAAEQSGVVLSVGPGATSGVKAGDRVLFGTTSGQEILLDRGEPNEAQYIILRDDDLLAVIEV